VGLESPIEKRKSPYRLEFSAPAAGRSGGGIGGEFVPSGRDGTVGGVPRCRIQRPIGGVESSDSGIARRGDSGRGGRATRRLFVSPAGVAIDLVKTVSTPRRLTTQLTIKK